VRLTELGIRGVDGETVEAAQAFGAPPSQILRGVQLPRALPTVMAGINQLIMLALSMAVIAGMAGADGLGKMVVQGISSMDVPMGVESGLGIVLIAVFLDRCTAALAQPSPSSLLGLLERARQERRRADAEDAASAASDLVVAGPRRATP
jgi:glycine betaine/proline transport system permease protein